MTEIRDARDTDLDWVLTLNREWEAVLSPLDGERLKRLHEQAAVHRIAEPAGRPTAFLMAFREGSGYDSSNYRWFAQRYPRFLYIDRVVVASAAQGHGLGKALYQDLFRIARSWGITTVCCEFDVMPPNPVSERFHEALGFQEVDQRRYGTPPKMVSLRVIQI
ncbi:GNAT family N-acetyltransferase [Gammaproteobacteria bacterium AB-CW1]|uniref:GNAT family N-acetyltransferase n=1 Tax=Natronospira elongata TaxID=3110268 RepID=A0AAP6MN76_9GAMM|nr:GNAT family N-acetyltransferase [Gammaproteobacteria bacterium AB-CW1]